jgi:serine protease Do
MMNGKPLARSVIAASVLAALAGGFAHFGAPGLAHAETAMTPPPAVTAPSAGAVPLGGKSATDFSGIVDRFGPAVVNVSVTGKARQVPASAQQGEMPELDPNDPFFEFFKRFGTPSPRGPQQGERPLQRGLGSGFIVSADGLILTNAHVVDGADEVTVKLTDRREFKAKVLGSDKESDVAVLKINAKDLPVVKLGDPNVTKVGEPVLAIGSPYGLDNTATSGIVSAKSRSLPDGTYVPFLQTDVAVNPGNSGGPLFNLNGEVIGINSQIYSRTGGYQGLSFAIPIDIATNVEEQLVHSGKVTRGRLGVSIQEVNQALAESFGLKKLQGALVSSVEKDSPAERAGLQAGDVIVRIGDHEINRSSDLPSQVAVLKPGATAKLEVIRNGSPKTLTATISEMKDKTVASAKDTSQKQGKLGVAVHPLAKEQQRELGIPGGLLVENASGPAAKAGIQPGDIIVSANGKPVTSVEQLQTLLGKAGKHIALLVQRDTDRIFIPVDLG